MTCVVGFETFINETYKYLELTFPVYVVHSKLRKKSKTMGSPTTWKDYKKKNRRFERTFLVEKLVVERRGDRSIDSLLLFQVTLINIAYFWKLCLFLNASPTSVYLPLFMLIQGIVLYPV